MARDGGGGAALGWTLLGFLAGIAITLGIQTLMGGGDRSSHAEASSGSVHVTISAAGGAAKKAAPAASGAAAPVAAAQPEAEVADDAAAAGMTSRLPPANGQSTDRAPGEN